MDIYPFRDEVSSPKKPFRVAVNERKRFESRLLEVEERFHAIVECCADGMLLVDQNGRIELVNKAAEDIFGYTRRELLGRPVEILLPGQSARRHEEDRKKYLEKPVQRPMGHGRDLYGVRKDGTQIPLEIGLSPIRLNGEKPHILATVVDISERKRSEETLRRYSEELKRSNAELEQFAFVASHDLKEPLNVVSNLAELLLRKYKDKRLDQKAEEFISYMSENLGHMRALVDDLLEYSRIGKAAKSFEKVDCRECAQQAIRNLRVAIENNGAKVTLDPLPVILGDRIQIVQLFQNLVGNALKFHGAEPPHIHISSRQQGENWFFSVKDNGIGIKKEYFGWIFEIFHRLREDAARPGTGLGLAICRKIVDRHGGRIGVESEYGKGSTFFFHLPALKDK